MRLLDPDMLHLIWLLSGCVLLLLMAHSLRRSAMRRFVEPEAADRVRARVSGRKRLLRAVLVLIALTTMIVGMARPAWDPQPRKVVQSGRDVVFLVDVSRSMLAQDLRPNRLDHAKLAIKDVLEVADGDRVAIIAFAGTSTVRCPLTNDYAFARMTVDDLSVISTSRGGTMIGDAIRLAMDQLFSSDEGEPSDRYRDIFLITDGEDQGSFPVEAAAAAGQRGVRIIAIGIGNDEAGTPIPNDDPGSTDAYVRFDGEIVRSRMDAATLRQVAEVSRDGVYIHAGTGYLELDGIYERLMRQAERRSFGETEAMRYDEGFVYFVALALALLMMEVLIDERRAPH